MTEKLFASLTLIQDEELCSMADLPDGYLPDGYVVNPELCLKERPLQFKELAAIEHFELDSIIEEIIC